MQKNAERSNVPALGNRRENNASRTFLGAWVITGVQTFVPPLDCRSSGFPNVRRVSDAILAWGLAGPWTAISMWCLSRASNWLSIRSTLEAPQRWAYPGFIKQCTSNNPCFISLPLSLQVSQSHSHGLISLGKELLPYHPTQYPLTKDDQTNRCVFRLVQSFRQQQ